MKRIALLFMALPALAQVTISMTPASASVAGGGTAVFTVTTTSPSVTGVTRSTLVAITQSLSSPVGTLTQVGVSLVTSTSGLLTAVHTVTYAAPATVAATQALTLTVTSTYQASAIALATIKLVPPAPPPPPPPPPNVITTSAKYAVLQLNNQGFPVLVLSTQVANLPPGSSCEVDWTIADALPSVTSYSGTVEFSDFQPYASDALILSPGETVQPPDVEVTCMLSGPTPTYAAAVTAALWVGP